MRLVLALLPLAAQFACSTNPPPGAIPESPAQRWVPAEQAQSTETPGASNAGLISEADLRRPFSLGRLLELGLSTNPRTKASWHRAVAGYAALGVARSAYYPSMSAGVQYSRDKRLPRTGSGAEGVLIETTKGPFAAVDYLLFDFGGREARIEEQQHALVALNYNHSTAIQEVVLQVQRAYYEYVALAALEKNQQAVVTEARTNLEAAEQRRRSGLSTIADVLQAQTALSAAELSLLRIQGSLAAARGTVLTAAGVPASAPVELTEIDLHTIDDPGLNEQVEELIQQAKKRNPQLAAARANAEALQARSRTVERSGWPTLRASGRWDELRRDGGWTDQYTVAGTLSVPVFTGFSYSYQLKRAEAEAHAAQADYEYLAQQRTIAVWTDYYANRTAQQQIKTSEAMYTSAEQSYQVALGRYREGVGSIIDLLSAQASLEQARAAQVRARSDYLLSLAQLRYDLGVLGVDTSSPTEGTL